MSEEDPGPGPTSPGRRCGRAQRRLKGVMPDKAQMRWSARPVDRRGAPAAASTPCRNPGFRGRSSESSAGARSAAGGAPGREKQHRMCAVVMRFERAHLPLGLSTGGGAVAHQPSQPIGNLGPSRRFKERKQKRAPNTTQIPISRINSESDDRKRTIDD